MLAEHKLIKLSYDILFVFRVALIKGLNKLGFNETLLVETFLVFQNFKCHEFFGLVVENTKHNTE